MVYLCSIKTNHEEFCMKYIVMCVLLAFASVANAAWVETTCSGEQCWNYDGKLGSMGDKQLLALVQLVDPSVTYITRFEADDGGISDLTGPYAYVVFKGAQDLWLLTSYSHYTGQLGKYDISFVAYFGNGGPDLDVEVPEPLPLALLGLGLIGLGLTRKFV